MKGSKLNKKILIFAFPVIVFCLWVFLSSSNAQLIPDHARELAEIRAAIKAKGARWKANETSISRLPLEKARMLCGTILSAGIGARSAGVDAAAPYVESTTLPLSFDWRNKDGINYVTSIKDQMNCGSCWAFATVGGFESQILIDNSTLTIDLSEQYVVSCNTYNNGCCGGYMDRVSDFLLNIGTTYEACIPYSSDGSYYYRGRRCIDSSEPCPSSCTIGGGDLNLETISGWEWIPNTVVDIKTALYENGTIPCGMAVFDDFRFYEEGVYEHLWGTYLGGHAVIIIGWDDENQCWICKNSWGTSWGEGYDAEPGGYFRIAWGNSYIGDSAVKLYFAPVVNCSSNFDCNDDNPCTGDICINPGTVESYCENSPVSDNTSPAGCEAGNICCDGQCVTPVCSNDGDCSDEYDCTIDTCNYPNSCNASCINTWPACGIEDGCCGPNCLSSTDPDCTVTCLPVGAPCEDDSECCSGRCRGRPGGKTCRE